MLIKNNDKSNIFTNLEGHVYLQERKGHNPSDGLPFRLEQVRSSQRGPMTTNKQ